MTPAPPTTPTTPAVHPIGRHVLRVDGNNVECTFIGPMDEAETRAMFAVYDDIFAEYGRMCILTDLTQAGSIDPRARRLCVEWGQRNASRLVAGLHGGSRAVRVVITLVLSALRALTGTTLVAGFFETRAEAERFLAPHRRVSIQA